MNLFELAVKIEADTTQAKKSISEYKKDVMNLAQTYKKQGMDMSSAMKKAYSEIDKSQYETAEKSKNDSKKFSDNWVDAGEKVSGIAKKIGNGLKTAAKIGAAAVGVASAAIAALTTQAVNSFAEYEQLAGGAQKIFDQMDYSKIATDANNAYKELGLSANQYLSVINDVGATFAATMGDEAGYEAAKTGLKAISDYASGTGKNVDELSQKFTLITRSTSSYQSIADQFSGILPATSAEFLEQAQAAGILSDSYTQLTEVPIAEYQAAVSQMLETGVKELGLFDNTVNEAFSTLSGSLSMAKGAWSNLVTGLADGNADIGKLVDNLVTTIVGDGTPNNLGVLGNIMPAVERALDGVTKLVKKGVPEIMKTVPKLLAKNLPVLVEAAIDSFESILESIEENQEMLATTVLNIIQYLSQSFVEMIPTILRIGLGLIVSIADGISQNLETLLPAVTGVIFEIVDILTQEDVLSNLIDAAFEIVSALATHLLSEDVLDDLIDACVSIITTISTALIDNIDKLSDAAIEIIDALATYLTDPENLKKIVSAGVKIAKSLVDGLISMQNPLNETAGSLADSVVSKFTGIDLSGAGKKVAGSFLSALISEFTKAASGNNPVFKFVLDKLIGGSMGAFVDGSHRSGLDYVPYDGYIAELHKGEKVLTASEASGYGGVSFGDINIYVNGDRHHDENALAAAIGVELQNLAYRRAAVFGNA